MAISVTIAGSTKTSSVLLNQLSIDYSLGSDWTATFPVKDVVSTSAAYRPALDAEVTIADGATTLFHGTVTRVEDKPIAPPHIGTLTVVTARAKSQVVDQIIVNESGAAGFTREDWVDNFIANYLSAYGITKDATMTAGATLEAQTFKDVTMREALNHLSTVTGDLWRITPSDELQFFAAGVKTASYSLTAANKQSYGPITWDKTREKYVNSVVLRYGTETPVEKTFTATGTGSVSSWVLDYTPIVNAANGMIVSRGYVVEGSTIVTLSETGGGGAYTYEDSTNTLTRAAGNLGVGVVIAMIYSVQFPQTVTVENSGEIASNGRFQGIFEAADIFDLAAATELANGLLRRYLTVPKWVRLSTRQGFVMPGDQITLTFTDRTVSGNHIITQVRATTIGKGTVTYALTCLSGDELQESWTDRLRDVLGTGGSNAAGGTVSGGVLPNLSGRFADDVLAHAGTLADEVSMRSSLTAGLTNATTIGPGVLIGRPDATWGWGIVANYVHLASGADGGAGRRTLCFMFSPEAAGSNGTALELSKDDSNTANVYYLTCPPSTTINLGAPTSAIGNGKRIENLYGSAFEFLSTAVGKVSGTRPTLGFFDLSGSRLGRLEQALPSAIALTQNLLFDGTNWQLDDTGKTGWLMQIDDSGTTDEFAIARATAGSNPRTPTVTFKVSASGQLFERGRTTAIGEWIPVSFSAGNFTAGGSQTWTVASGDQVTYAYSMSGLTMTLAIVLNTTTVGGTPNQELRVAIPGSFTATRYMGGSAKALDNGTDAAISWQVATSGTYVSLYRTEGGGGANWAASTDNTAIRCVASFEVS